MTFNLQLLIFLTYQLSEVSSIWNIWHFWKFPEYNKDPISYNNFYEPQITKITAICSDYQTKLYFDFERPFYGAIEIPYNYVERYLGKFPYTLHIRYNRKNDNAKQCGIEIRGKQNFQHTFNNENCGIYTKQIFNGNNNDTRQKIIKLKIRYLNKSWREKSIYCK
ncbi:unnamed protein product [Gordionus sp. m RMFG-2023]|uniref:uncharacterized protein LOC135930061 n=1 Tax=Gordionus sp. m RMFG-2023 TaxID=3053472 RepID=UPI0030DE9690